MSTKTFVNFRPAARRGRQTMGNDTIEIPAMTGRERIVLFLPWAFTTTISLTKPFHIDDPVYLLHAR